MLHLVPGRLKMVEVTVCSGRLRAIRPDLGEALLLGLDCVPEWTTIFPSATKATALSDRFVHHADEGKSYSLREAEETKRKPRKSRA